MTTVIFVIPFASKSNPPLRIFRSFFISFQTHAWLWQTPQEGNVWTCRWVHFKKTPILICKLNSLMRVCLCLLQKATHLFKMIWMLKKISFHRTIFPETFLFCKERHVDIPNPKSGEPLMTQEQISPQIFKIVPPLLQVTLHLLLNSK